MPVKLISINNLQHENIRQKRCSLSINKKIKLKKKKLIKFCIKFNFMLSASDTKLEMVIKKKTIEKI